MSTARGLPLTPPPIPAVLYAAVRRENLERAVRRGTLRSSKRSPIAMFAHLEAVSPFDRGETVHLKIDAASAVAEGVRLVGLTADLWYARDLPLRLVGLVRTGESVATAERIRAAGGVVVRDGDKPQVLLLRKGRGPFARWVLPKGRQQPGESDETTAAREVLEETGLPNVVVLRELSPQEYFDDWRGRIVIKKVAFFLMRCEASSLKIRVQRQEGFRKGKWVTFDEALRLTPPSRAHRALRAARALVETPRRSHGMECA